MGDLVDISSKIDVTNILTALFLWLFFGFLSSMVNCDVQRMLRGSGLARHCVLLVSFFFLFTLIDSSNKEGLPGVLIKTLCAYILFVLATKTKGPVILVALAIMAVAILIKRYDQEYTREDDLRRKKIFAAVNIGLNALVVAIILGGVIHYLILQKIEYGHNFSLFKFVTSTNRNCKDEAPVYRRASSR